MNIKTIIEAISIAANPAATFRYGWKAFQNLKADKEATFPLHYLDFPIKGNISLKQSGLIERIYPLTILFAGKTKLDDTPAQHDTVIATMRAESTKFIQKAQENANVHFIRDIRETEVINIFDLNMSGIILELSLVPFPDDTCS